METWAIHPPRPMKYDDEMIIQFYCGDHKMRGKKKMKKKMRTKDSTFLSRSLANKTGNEAFDRPQKIIKCDEEQL